MMHLVRLQRLLLLGSGLLISLYLVLAVGVAPFRSSVQVIPPSWVHYVPIVGVILLALSLLISAAAERGWRRLIPLLGLVALPAIALVIGFVQLATLRSEIDRVTLPNGQVIMMAIEPGITDTILGLWEEPIGWFWQTLFKGGIEVTYSEDHSFTTNPRLVITADGRHLLIRRGGIWTDCWTIEARLKPCLLPGEHTVPDAREEWLGRSSRIAAIIGVDPSPP